MATRDFYRHSYSMGIEVGPHEGTSEAAQILGSRFPA